MAAKSTKRVAKTDKKRALDRPFDPEILERARAIAQRYRIVLEPVGGDCEYLGTSLELPGVYADGATADACVKETREALTAAIAYLIESGKEPPVPADEQARTKQVNIRLTEAEQRKLKEAAKARGFTDISDYVRTTSLQAYA